MRQCVLNTSNEFVVDGSELYWTINGRETNQKQTSLRILPGQVSLTNIILIKYCQTSSLCTPLSYPCVPIKKHFPFKLKKFYFVRILRPFLFSRINLQRTIHEISNVQISDQGDYKCHVITPFDSVESISGRLEVRTETEFISEPTNTQVTLKT